MTYLIIAFRNFANAPKMEFLFTSLTDLLRDAIYGSNPWLLWE